MGITQRPSPVLLAMLSRANRPQVWFWAAAICFVVSTSMFWNRSLTVDAPEEIIPDMEATALPVLDETHVVAQPRMYPASYGNRPRPAGRPGVQQVGGVQPVTSVEPGVVHAAWQTDDPAQQRRVERVSVKSVEVDQPSPVWLTGSIEIAQPETSAALAPVRQTTTHPLRLVEQAAARTENSAAPQVAPAHESVPTAVSTPKSREAVRPAPAPAAVPAAPAGDLPRIIPAARSNRK